MEFLNTQDMSSNQSIEIVEIFRGSSQLAVLNGFGFLEKYEMAWSGKALSFHGKSVGTFPLSELKDFFGNYEIVIEHKIIDKKDRIVFHTLLPYQAIFIASGESII